MTLTNYRPANISPQSSGVSSAIKNVLGEEANITGGNFGGISAKVSSPLEKEDQLLGIALKRKNLAKEERIEQKAFTPNQEEKLVGLYSTANKLNKLADEFESSNYKTGLAWGAIPLDVKQYVRPVKETGFLGDLRQQFNLYRKYITGVQAGFPEIKNLQISFPADTNTRPVLLEKLRRTVNSNNEIINDWLRLKEAQGYNVQSLRKMFGNQEVKGLFDQ